MLRIVAVEHHPVVRQLAGHAQRLRLAYQRVGGNSGNQTPHRTPAVAVLTRRFMGMDSDVVPDVIGFMNNFTGERMVHLLDLFGPLVDVENVRQEQLGEVMDGLRR